MGVIPGVGDLGRVGVACRLARERSPARLLSLTSSGAGKAPPKTSGDGAGRRSHAVPEATEAQVEGVGSQPLQAPQAARPALFHRFRRPQSLLGRQGRLQLRLRGSR
eukprot:scaffold8280_cov258-Pinguiococcus_pyrenoidosus.AAC.4